MFLYWVVVEFYVQNDPKLVQNALWAVWKYCFNLEALYIHNRDDWQLLAL